MDDQYTHLQFIIGRFDHYFDSLNNKASFYLGFNTFIVGGLVAIYYTLNQTESFNRYEEGIFLIAIILGLASMILLLWGVRPFLKDSRKQGAPPVPIFFGSVARLTPDNYLNELMNHDKVGMVKEMAQQAHTLACGLKQKFICVQYANYMLIAEFALLVNIVIIILNKI